MSMRVLILIWTEKGSNWPYQDPRHGTCPLSLDSLEDGSPVHHEPNGWLLIIPHASRESLVLYQKGIGTCLT